MAEKCYAGNHALARMTDSFRFTRLLRNLLLLCSFAGVASWAGMRLMERPQGSSEQSATSLTDSSVSEAASKVDAAMQPTYAAKGVVPLAKADDRTLMRRLSLALTGSIPSLEELLEMEASRPADVTSWWTDRLLKDRRTSDYLAERLVRVYVGTENGPFLIYRRRRLVEWLSDALQQNRRYDQIVKSLIDSHGIWTTSPEVNFVTVTNEPGKGPDEAKLAARVSRAFLGVRMDCVQCHDGKLGSTWKQEDFHRLAAYFGQSKFGVTGLRDDPKMSYKHRYLGQTDDVVVAAMVPWKSELLPQQTRTRAALAEWVTSKDNRPFSRTIVNRMWALLFNRPLISPVDDIPLNGPFPPAMETLADDFIDHGYDLHRLIRVITGSELFQRASRSPDAGHPVTPEMEAAWASFPVTRLRPEQMAGSVVQAASLASIDSEAHVLFRIKKDIDVANFVKRYGDQGEDAFDAGGGTIPQRLLIMNGNLVTDNSGNNPILNASTRISLLARDSVQAVEAAYLAVLSRRPTSPEKNHFVAQLDAAKGRNARSQVMSDLYWTLLNSTEFSWNH